MDAMRLREILDYDRETGVFRWRIKPSLRVDVGSVAGSACPSGYLSISVDGTRHRAHRLAWLHVHGEWPRGEIDHRDRDRANNSISNLRVASRSENQRNSALYSNSRSGLRGVTLTRSGKYAAHMKVDGRKKHIGSFETAEEAASAYVAFASLVSGEFMGETRREQ